MPTILSTKRLNFQQKEQLLREGFKVIDENFIEVETINFRANTDFDILIFTSQNAVESITKNHIFPILQKKKAICVGEKTKIKLQHSGFEVLDCTAYAEDLTQIIEQKYFNKSFLFFCGNLRSNILPDFFKKHRLTYCEVIVYKTTKTPKPINEKLDGILFFSPSGVESFLQKNSLSTEQLFCIGKTTANALKNFPQPCTIAPFPTQEHTIEKCIEFYKNKS